MAISMTGNGTGLEPFLALFALQHHLQHLVYSLQFRWAKFHPQRVNDRAIYLGTLQTPQSPMTMLSKTQFKARA